MARDVIIACDFASEQALFEFLAAFDGLEAKPYLKVGMELYYAAGPGIVRELKARGYRVFLDLKLHDIPTTVGKAAKVLGALGADIINVHAAGGAAMMRAAVEGAAAGAAEAGLPAPAVIAVTQLTSTDAAM
ncbi:MAG: orotidine-5'-phosphate decarboxylase, partial [Eggerthellaceae bacterium]|nr:orotidine-5'-phosphate decarboxylase [Eggerthellaceae bacterium]